MIANWQLIERFDGGVNISIPPAYRSVRVCICAVSGCNNKKRDVSLIYVRISREMRGEKGGWEKGGVDAGPPDKLTNVSNE